MLEWELIVRRNAAKIIDAANAIAEPEPVCALVDLNTVRKGRESIGVSHVIIETKLQGAVPLDDPDPGRRLVCIPIGRERLLATLEPHENVEELRKLARAKGTLLLWAVCFDGIDRRCIDIYARTPEVN
jgi:hypothetical protein